MNMGLRRVFVREGSVGAGGFAAPRDLCKFGTQA